MQLLGAILKNREVRVLREIDPNLHLQGNDEIRTFRAIRSHFDEYQALPSINAIQESRGVVLPDTDDTCEYYMQRVRQRAFHSAITHEDGPYNQLQEALQSPSRSMESLITAIDQMYHTKMQFIQAGTGIETSASLLPEVMRQFEDARMQSGLSGITTGYDPLDEQMGGYQNGDLVVWVGRPGRSKSWKLLNQCYAAWSAGYKPLYVSMEMGSHQNMRRLIGINSGINPTHMRRGTLSTLATPLLEQSISQLLELQPLHMVTANFSRTVDQIQTFIEEYTPDICYIDAGYLLAPRKTRYGSGGRRETISDVIEELKELGANTGIPIVITVQFNRQAEHRRRSASGESFNPIAHLSLAEIGETDVIGQVATHVLGIEYPPAPLQRSHYRCFGFLKGREGESGWWLTNFIRTQTSAVDLSLVSLDDPVYEAIRRQAANNTDGPAVDPSHRSNLMRLQRG
jgi:replicative DNA helicase